MQNVRNIRDDHVQSYINELMEADRSMNYIKGEFSAINAMHKMIIKPRYRKLSMHGGLDLDDRIHGGVNRRFAEHEYEDLLKVARENNMDDLAYAAEITYHTGLRIIEVTDLHRNDLIMALKDDSITVEGKGGLVRSVGLNDEVIEVFETLVERTPVGSRVFVDDYKGEKVDQVVKRFQNFFSRYRDQFQDPNLREEHECNLTFHGLRHTYAQNLYNKLIDQNYDVLEAELEVAKNLGHGRHYVTRIYLAK